MARPLIFNKTPASAKYEIVRHFGIFETLCCYTGIPCKEFVTVPEFLVVKEAGSSTSTAPVGAWATYAVFLRHCGDLAESGELTDERFANIASWVAQTIKHEGSVQMAPKFNQIKRFGGPLSDDQYLMIASNLTGPMTSAEQESMRRVAAELARGEKKAAAEPVPSVFSLLKDAVKPDEVNFIEIAAFPAGKTYVIQRKEPTNELKNQMTQLLSTSTFPFSTGPRLVCAPQSLPAKAKKILGLMVPKAEKAKKVTAVRVKPADVEAKKRPSAGASSLPKKAKVNKKREQALAAAVQASA